MLAETLLCASRRSSAHTQSLLDGGSLQDYLTKVATWMNSNKDQGESRPAESSTDSQSSPLSWSTLTTSSLPSSLPCSRLLDLPTSHTSLSRLPSRLTHGPRLAHSSTPTPRSLCSWTTAPTSPLCPTSLTSSPTCGRMPTVSVLSPIVCLVSRTICSWLLADHACLSWQR